MILRVLFAVACVCQSTALTTLPDIWETRIIPIRNSEILTVSTRNSLEIITQILDPVLNLMESESVFNDSDVAGVSLYPDAAKLDSGGYIVVWGAVLIPQLTFGQLMTNNLNNREAVFKIGEQGRSQLRPRVVTLPDGFVVVWGFRDDLGTGVAFQIYNDDALQIGEEKVITVISRSMLSAASFAYTTGIVPSIAVSLDRSEFVVIWQIEKFIQGRTYTNTGAEVTKVFDVVKDAESSRTLSVCAMPDEYVLSWTSNGEALVQGFDSKGTLMGGVSTVSKKQSDANTAVVCMPGVGFAVSFLASVEEERGIYIRFFDTQHRRKSRDLFVGKTDSFSDHSSVLNSAGEIVTVWDSHVTEPTHPSSHIVSFAAPAERPKKVSNFSYYKLNESSLKWAYGCLFICIIVIFSRRFCLSQN